MKKETVSYIPAVLCNYVRDQKETANRKLDILREYMNAHGEGWEDVCKYVERGWDYKIKERQSECLAHMNKLGFPAYLRTNQMQLAVDDLGVDNLAYWRGLPALMVAPGVSLAEDVEVTQEGWRVRDSWAKAIEESITRTLSEQAAEDWREANDLVNAIISMRDKGYDVNSLLTDLQTWKTHGELSPEWIDTNYDPAEDMRLKLE